MVVNVRHKLRTKYTNVNTLDTNLKKPYLFSIMSSFERLLIRVSHATKPHESEFAELGSVLKSLDSIIAQLLLYIGVMNAIPLSEAHTQRILSVQLQYNTWILEYVRKQLLPLQWKIFKMQTLAFLTAIAVVSRLNVSVGIPEWLSWIASTFEAVYLAPYVESLLIATFLSSFAETTRLQIKHICYAGPVWMIVNHLARVDNRYMRFAKKYGITANNRPS